MALANNTRPAPFGAIAAFNFVSFFEGIFTSVVEWNTLRKTQNTLSDRELDDIGLSRGDITNLPARF